MVGTRIDIKRLNLDELLGVVSIYPWYAGARKELCSRMAASGTLSRQQLSQAFTDRLPMGDMPHSNSVWGAVLLSSRK